MGKDDATWLRICYVLVLLVTIYTASKAGTTLGIQTGWVDRYEWYKLASYLVSGIIGAGALYWLSQDQNRKEYYLSAISELRKVTWPNGADTKRMTIVVCVVVGVFAGILAVFDFVWTTALGFLLA
tara:strand:+ start:92 stop:469 length:378 start_codon:yes stop_codon:yes gene_type:complete